MPRLGLLAAAFSNGTIGVYSLPHPEALAAHHQSKGKRMGKCISLTGSNQVHLKYLCKGQSMFSLSGLF